MLLHAFQDASDQMISCLDEALRDSQTRTHGGKTKLTWPLSCQSRPAAAARTRRSRLAVTWRQDAPSAKGMLLRSAGISSLTRPLLQGVLPAPCREEQLGEGPRNPAWEKRGNVFALEISACSAPWASAVSPRAQVLFSSTKRAKTSLA